jgi:hypothetical protein
MSDAFPADGPFGFSSFRSFATIARHTHLIEITDARVCSADKPLTNYFYRQCYASG